MIGPIVASVLVVSCVVWQLLDLWRKWRRLYPRPKMSEREQLREWRRRKGLCIDCGIPLTWYVVKRGFECCFMCIAAHNQKSARALKGGQK